MGVADPKGYLVCTIDTTCIERASSLVSSLDSHVGTKNRDSSKVSAKVVQSTDKSSLQSFVAEDAEPGAIVYADEVKAYEGVASFHHEAVKHSVGEYVCSIAHSNGIGSFWSLVKRRFHSTCHKMSPKHLDRYVQECAGRRNDRDCDTIDQMSRIVMRMSGTRLRYQNLIADNGPDGGGRLQAPDPQHSKNRPVWEAIVGNPEEWP